MKQQTRWSVILDFDGTITADDTGRDLLTAFASDEWLSLAVKYRSGRMTSQEMTSRSYRLLRTTEPELTQWIARRAAAVRLRPGIVEFVAWCRTKLIPITVASSGIDLYVQPILEAAGC